MSKCISTYNGLVWLYRHIHQTGYQTASRINLIRIDVHVQINRIVTLDDHRHFFQCCITRTFTDTIHRNFYLTGTIQYTGNGVGCSQSQVVMAMSGQNRLVDIIHMFHQILDFGTIFFRETITGSIWNIHHCSTGCNHRFYYTSQIFIVCTSRIFRIKFHIIGIATSITNSRDRTFDDFFTTGIELIANMSIRSSDTRMNTFTLSKAKCLSSHINVTLYSTSQSTDSRPCYSLRYFYNRIEVTWTGNRETRFNHIHS